MKRLRLRFASIFVVNCLLLIVAANGLAQCESEPIIGTTGKVLKEFLNQHHPAFQKARHAVIERESRPTETMKMPRKCGRTI